MTEIDETVAEQGLMESMLGPIREARDAAAAYKHDDETLSEPVKAWLLSHDGEKLYDLERGLVGKIGERSVGTRTYDMPALAQNRPDLLARLLECVALTIDFNVAKAHGLEKDIAPFENPRGKSYALLVEKQ